MSKVVLITGSTTGIGASTARLLSSKGYKVVVSGRRQDKGEEVVESIKSSGGQAIFFKVDVNSEDQVKELIRLTIEHYGRLDAAVNNAACALDDKIFGESSTDKFREMIETNVFGVFWCMQQEIKAMLNNGGGSIVNLTSMAGLNGIPLTSTYSATKHAVVGLTKSAALDYATQNIRINAVAPGAIRTEILNYAIESGAYPLEAIEGMFPMKRLGEPEEVAQGIAFLLENTYTTGTVLSIDGGFNAK